MLKQRNTIKAHKKGLKKAPCKQKKKSNIQKKSKRTITTAISSHNQPITQQATQLKRRNRTFSTNTTDTTIEFDGNYKLDPNAELPYHTKTDVYGATRTHYISDLEQLKDGDTVSLSGWIERIRPIGQLFFVVLRDHTGVVQATLEKPELDQHHEIFNKINAMTNGAVDMDTVSFKAYETGMDLGPEYVVSIKGVLQSRPAEMVKKTQAMGSKEVRIRSLRLLNKSKPLPISLHDEHDEITNEDLRMKYRYLDLRRDVNQYLIKLRSQLTMSARQAMYMLGFNEIETPYLVKSTPEGAREFLVPSRNPGKFYALPQSPQQFKQLLMVSGFDKYFQIAKCFRDESGRQDRQPEFTQLDMELTFTTPEMVMKSVETMINNMHLTTYGVPMNKLKKIRYIDVMNRFGSDKPDIRYSCELQDITKYFTNYLFNNLNENAELNATLLKTNPSSSNESTTSPQPKPIIDVTHTDINDGTIASLLNIYPPFLQAKHALHTSGQYHSFIMKSKAKQQQQQNTQDTTTTTTNNTNDDEIELIVNTIDNNNNNNDTTTQQIKTKPLARHPFPVVKMIVARDLNDVLSKGKNKDIMSKILKDCREGSNGLQPTIISCNKWKIKAEQTILNDTNVQKQLTQDFNLQPNDMMFVLSGDWENVCNGLGKIRNHLKTLMKDGNSELLPAIIDGERIMPPAPLQQHQKDGTVDELNLNPYTRFNDYLIEQQWVEQNAQQYYNTTYAQRKPLNPNGPIPTFHWVVDFPLLEPVIPTAVYQRLNNNNNNTNTTDNISNEPISVNAMHHPFTAPHPDDMQEFIQIMDTFKSKIKTDPITNEKLISKDNNPVQTNNDPATLYPLDLLTVQQQLSQIRALHYDLVSNGLEVGGGSIRIHNSQIQRDVFDLLQVPHAKFNHLLSALDYGAPPHGGFAAGLDRVVAIFGSPTKDPLKLKDVIAFPKTGTGNDLLLGSPNEQTKEQLDEYSIAIKQPPAKEEKPTA